MESVARGRQIPFEQEITEHCDVELGLGDRSFRFEVREVDAVWHDHHPIRIDSSHFEKLSLFLRDRDDGRAVAGSLVEMAHTEHLTLATDLLDYFAHWITPEGMPKRFDTHFFLTTAPDEQQAAHDRLETSEGIWISPTEALARFERKEFPLVFATIYQLRELAAFGSVQEALASTTKQRVPTRIPVLKQEGGKTRVFLQEDADNAWDVPEHMTRS